MVYGERPQNKIEVVSNHLRVFPLQKGACKYKILDGSHQRGFLNKIYHRVYLNVIYTLLLNVGASPVTQLVKDPPAVQETWVRFLGWEGP